MSWFLCNAGKSLRSDFNRLFPNRDKGSDGSIGDASHKAKKSDHNADWDSRPPGMVRAIDVDRDLIIANVSASVRAMTVLIDEIIRDPRVAYVIFQKRIWQNPAVFNKGGWQPYYGANSHSIHVHISFRRGAKWENDGSPWFKAAVPAPAPAPKPIPAPVHVPTEEEIIMAGFNDLLETVKNAIQPIALAVNDALERLRRLEVKAERNDLRFIVFKAEADGAFYLADVHGREYARIPDADTHARTFGVFDQLGYAYPADGVKRSWEQVCAWDQLRNVAWGATVKNPAAFGTQKEWDAFVPYSEPEPVVTPDELVKAEAGE